MPYLYKRKALPAKHRAVKNYLYSWAKKYIDFNNIENNIEQKLNTPVFLENPIWYCWLQGEKDMPPVIKLCYDSVKRMAGERRVELVTFDNVKHFVDVPQTIKQKLSDGELSFTHYADYLRILLLKTHGGLWIDASIYVTQPIDFKECEGAIYTLKSHKVNDVFVSDYRWTVSLLGCARGNLLFSKLELLMRKYIEDHDEFIDFFLFDYLISVLYDNIPSIKKMIDEVVYSNEEFYGLHGLMNEPFNKCTWDKLSGNQGFHKLSWKSNYLLETPGGEQTFFSHLLDIND